MKLSSPARAFFSFSAMADPTMHQAYSEWHQLDHLPENRALDGVIFGERWVRTPRCVELSASTSNEIPEPPGGISGLAPDFGPQSAQYMTMYWFAEPVEDTVANWNDLAARSFHWGRRPEIGWTDRWMGFFVPVKGYVNPRVLVGPQALPFRPHTGIAVVVTRVEGTNRELNELFSWHDVISIPQAVRLEGVAGCWTFASLAHFAGNHGNEQPYEAIRIQVYFLDGEVESTLEELRSLPVDEPANRPRLETVVLDSPFLPITPWHWNWFDPSST
ncbi:MAG: hypothetical protein O3C62_08950 [Actinomycetota bacterium]|nr:hypothetical protein [Actinomycetota bacterium]MDA3001794.1 hypothetical protein [Actinomycetota bacterium]